MDKMEQKLRNYYQYHCEYQPEAISGEFIERLKALESVPEAKRPRRRYLLPIAAAAALAVCLGSVWAWQRFTRPEDTQTPNITLEEPVSPAADHPVLPTEVGTPETKEPAKQQTPVQPKPEASVSPTKPGQSGTVQPRSDDPMPTPPDAAVPAAPNIPPQAAPGSAADEKPQNPTPGKPEDSAPVEPDAPTPAKPDAATPANEDDPEPVTPIDPTPVEPDDPVPPKPDDPIPPETEDPNPPDPTEADPPDAPQIPPEIGVVYLNADGRETLTLTLLSTGELFEIDVTGLLPFYPQTSQDPDSYWDTPLFPAKKIQYIGECNAFGWQISYSLTRSMSGSAKAEVTGLSQMEQAEKGEDNET